MPRALALLAVLAIVATLLLACGDEEDLGDNGASGDGQASPTTTNPPPGSPTTAPDQIAHPTGADDLVLRIEDVGGFVPQDYLLTRLPTFSLFGDGCYVVPGPVIEIYPPPALPNLQETCLNEEGVQEILTRAQEAGLLDGDAEYGLDTVADASTAVFTTNAGGVSTVVSAYALGIDEVPDPSLTPEEQAAREKLAAFAAEISDITSWMPANMIVAAEHPYEIGRMQIVTLPADAENAPVAPEDIEPQELAWPLDGDAATPAAGAGQGLAEFGEPYWLEGYRCGVVEGDDLATLMPALQEANVLTRWTSDGGAYVLYLRPLFPDEAGCQEPILI
jgi:hypothetical protein